MNARDSYPTTAQVSQFFEVEILEYYVNGIKV